MNKMESIRINKVTINIGVGDSPIETLKKAEQLITLLTDQKPVRTYAKATIPDLGVKKNAPIGAKVTLRRQKAEKFLKDAFEAIENTVKRKQFDKEGNLAFGVGEYIELPNIKYEPDIGMFGMDVAINLERLGYRISRRRNKQKKLPQKVRINVDDSIKFFKENFGVDLEEEE